MKLSLPFVVLFLFFHISISDCKTITRHHHSTRSGLSSGSRTSGSGGSTSFRQFIRPISGSRHQSSSKSSSGSSSSRGSSAIPQKEELPYSSSSTGIKLSENTARAIGDFIYGIFDWISSRFNGESGETGPVSQSFSNSKSLIASKPRLAVSSGNDAFYNITNNGSSLKSNVAISLMINDSDTDIARKLNFNDTTNLEPTPRRPPNVIYVYCPLHGMLKGRP